MQCRSALSSLSIPHFDNTWSETNIETGTTSDGKLKELDENIVSTDIFKILEIPGFWKIV